jgi:hypothetical protein
MINCKMINNKVMLVVVGTCETNNNLSRTQCCENIVVVTLLSMCVYIYI